MTKRENALNRVVEAQGGFASRFGFQSFDGLTSCGRLGHTSSLQQQGPEQVDRGDHLHWEWPATPGETGPEVDLVHSHHRRQLARRNSAASLPLVRSSRQRCPFDATESITMWKAYAATGRVSQASTCRDVQGDRTPQRPWSIASSYGQDLF